MKTCTVCLLVIMPLAAGCNFKGDDAEALARALEAGAKRLRASNRAEEVVNYEPPTGTNQIYSIVINESASLQPPFSGTGGPLAVHGGTARGGTTYHRRFVYVPKRLFMVKTNAGAEIVLRKDGDRIEVVEIR